MPVKANILDLDVHCLELIYSFLSLEDALNCSQANSYLYWVFVGWARRKHTRFWLLADIAEWELRLLSIIADNLKYLYVDVDDLNLFIAENYSRNSQKNRARTGILQVLNRCQRLNILKLKQYGNSRGAIEVLSALKNSPLKELHITTLNINVKVLSRFKDLEALFLNVKLTDRELLRVFRPMRHLRVLKLSERTSHSTLKHIVTYCPQLYELTFYNKPRKAKLNCKNANSSSIFRVLANKAKNLDSLNVNSVICDINQAEELSQIDSLTRLRCSFIDADCVLALKNMRNLKELRIANFSFQDITPIYLELIRECSQLQVLSIMDLDVPDDFALKAAKVRKELPSHSEPMTLIIYEHGVESAMAIDPDMMNTITYRRMTSNEIFRFL